MQRPSVKSANSGNRLLHVFDSVPGIGFERAQPGGNVADTKMVGANGGRQFIPCHWCGNRRSGLRTRRIGRNRGCAAVVAQIIDKDLAAAGGLGHVDRVMLWRAIGQLPRNVFTEPLGIVPIGSPRRERHDDVQPLSAGRFEEARELVFFVQ